MKRDKRNTEGILKQILPTASSEEIESACNRVLSQLHEAMPERVESFRFERAGKKNTEAPRPIQSLKPFDALVLLAVYLVPGEPNRINIYGKVCESWPKRVHMATMFTSLDKLEERGFVSQFEGAPSKDPTGQMRVRPGYQLTPQGERALAEARTAAQEVTGTLEDFA
jgi:hypothetical protein